MPLAANSMRCMLWLLALAPMVGQAQNATRPIARSLYVALGGDPLAGGRGYDTPRALALGIEQSHADSRWALRLGADYMRTTWQYSGRRQEELAAVLGVRYGRRSGVVRPYVFGGVGVADLRTSGLRIKGDLTYQDVVLSVDTTIAATSRWNGVLTPALGTDIRLGRLRLFTEARLNLYPRFLTDSKRYGADKGTKALYVGIKF